LKGKKQKGKKQNKTKTKIKTKEEDTIGLLGDESTRPKIQKH